MCFFLCLIIALSESPKRYGTSRNQEMALVGYARSDQSKGICKNTQDHDLIHTGPSMRQFIRHPSDIPIEYSFSKMVADEREYLKDISQGGLCFRASGNIVPGSAIYIKIPIHKPVFEAHGVVAWCRKANGHYDVGVEFKDVSTEFSVRMVEQVCHIEHYKKEVLAKEGRRLTGEEAAMEWIAKNAADFPR